MEPEIDSLLKNALDAVRELAKSSALALDSIHTKAHETLDALYRAKGGGGNSAAVDRGGASLEELEEEFASEMS